MTTQLISHTLAGIMTETLVHVELYFKYHMEKLEKKKIKNKFYNIYNLEDNSSILFTGYLFKECMQDVAELKVEEEDQVRFIKPNQLRERIEYMKFEIHSIPSDILHKLNCSIEYIEKHFENYIGAKVIW